MLLHCVVHELCSVTDINLLYIQHNGLYDNNIHNVASIHIYLANLVCSLGTLGRIPISDELFFSLSLPLALFLSYLSLSSPCYLPPPLFLLSTLLLSLPHFLSFFLTYFHSLLPPPSSIPASSLISSNACKPLAFNVYSI